MRIAYFDCFAGISGDMTIGALLDAGLDFDHLRAELGKLDLAGYRLERTRVKRHNIAATKFTVYLDGEEHPADHPGEPHEHPHPHEHAHNHPHEHPHPHPHGHEHAPRAEEHAHAPVHQPHRTLGDVREIIERAALSPAVKERAIRIFGKLAEAEAKMHDTTPDKVHFHEVGAVDAIVDVVGACIGLEALGVEEVRSSPVRTGRGLIAAAHGIMPVPAPGTLELLRGVPVEGSDIPYELVTPTGAAILTTIVSAYGQPPLFTPELVGYGAGGRDPKEIANLLRVSIGEAVSPDGTSEDRIVLLESNIDDMTPEVYGYLMERLFAAGARDVFLTPVIMKKNRPGIVVQVIADEATKDALAAVIFRETPTLGVRMAPMTRRVLPRRAGAVETPWGPVRTKIAEWNGRERVTPEYDDCATIARTHGVPILDVYEAANRLAETANRLAESANRTASGGDR